MSTLRDLLATATAQPTVPLAADGVTWDAPAAAIVKLAGQFLSDTTLYSTGKLDAEVEPLDIDPDGVIIRVGGTLRFELDIGSRVRRYCATDGCLAWPVTDQDSTCATHMTWYSVAGVVRHLSEAYRAASEAECAIVTCARKIGMTPEQIAEAFADEGLYTERARALAADPLQP